VQKFLKQGVYNICGRSTISESLKKKVPKPN